MMSVLINHCWCSDSNWGGQYNCRCIVGIDRFGPNANVWKDEKTEDWKNLIEKIESNYDLKSIIAAGKQLSMEDMEAARATYRLKPEVMKWLEENIIDRKTNKYETNPKGWAVGTDAYNVNSNISFSVFFESARQARKFIKRWSSIGNATDYLNYFKDKRYKYNPQTKTLQRIER